MLSIPGKYRRQRVQCEIDSASFGLCSIFIFKVDQLESAQLGYAVSENDIENQGDWRKEWLVIGYEDLCGDPIFIDSTSDDFTVYTAAHGEGTWAPVSIASSFENFMRILHLLNENKGNYSESVFERILNENPSVEIDFWKSIVQ
jgi:hypothetical protein